LSSSPVSIGCPLFIHRRDILSTEGIFIHRRDILSTEGIYG
jgi:hypothetical protein